MRCPASKRLTAALVLLLFVLGQCFIPMFPAAAADAAAFTIVDQTVSPAKTIQFTPSQIADLQTSAGVTESYSAYNTYPTFKWSPDISGIKLSTLLSQAGITSSAASRLIQIVGSDGYTTNLTWKDLFVDARYCFPDGKTSAGKTLVDPIISFSDMSGGGPGRLYFGQLAPQDQNFNAFAFNLYGGQLIVSSKLASAWTPVTTASIASGSKVSAGTKLTFTIPAADADAGAKVGYTLDGSTPNATSPYYNYSSWVDPSHFALSLDTTATSKTITVKTIVTGRGGLNSSVTSFTYTIGAGSGGSSGGSTGGGSSGGGSSSSGGSGSSGSGSTTAGGGSAGSGSSGSSSSAGGGGASTTTNSSTGPTVLTVVDARTGARKGLSAVDLAAVTRAEGNRTYSYSAYNTFPSVKSLSGTGPTVRGLLAKAGVSTPRANELITLTSSDGFSTSLTYGDMTSGRYYFPNGTVGTAQGATGSSAALSGASVVPAAIITSHNNGTFAIGQRQPNDQTYDSFVQNMVGGGTITIQAADATAYAAVTKTEPANPAVVKVGDTITLLLPSSIGRAKVYYTTDGSTPTDRSQMYNISAWKQNGGPADALPKITHSGKTVIKTIVIGRGGLPSPVSELVFATSAADLKGVPGAPTAATQTPGAAAGTKAATESQQNGASSSSSATGSGSSSGASASSGGVVGAVRDLGSKVFGSTAPKILGIPWGGLVVLIAVAILAGLISGKVFATRTVNQRLGKPGEGPDGGPDGGSGAGATEGAESAPAPAPESQPAPASSTGPPGQGQGPPSTGGPPG